MKKISLLLVLLFLLVNCSDDTVIVDPILEGTEITNFSFLKVNNPSLDSDVLLDINNNTIYSREKQ